MIENHIFVSYLLMLQLADTLGKHIYFYINLMRSNALCNECSIKSNKQRKKVLDRANVPSKPKKGEECSNCNRPWSGNWHRHHKGDDFISWLCGHCNMSFSDQRNKI